MKIYELDLKEVDRIIDTALREDIRSGDITTDSLFTEALDCEAIIRAKEEGILCGIDVARFVFEKFDSSIVWEEKMSDGDRVSAGDIAANIKGNQKHLLTAERVALNLLQRMSGIATLTFKYVDKISGLKTKIVDTRKTTPGIRTLEKYAVTVGGGYNHRFGLYDGVMIKDNHIKLAGGITYAVEKVRSKLGDKFKIEVETTNLNEVDEALKIGADIIMLDNMNTETMKEAVALILGKALVEASGGIALENVRKVAETGVDFISVGALTHSAKALDISIDML